MFTIKLYRDSGWRQRILEAESFTILRPNEGDTVAEITLHRALGPNGEYRDERHDVTYGCDGPHAGSPEAWERAIIENAMGKTTEMISLSPR